MSVIHLETWDSATAPALPAGWSDPTSAWTTSSGFTAFSNPNTVSGTGSLDYSASKDNNNGDARCSVIFGFGSVATGNNFQVVCRETVLSDASGIQTAYRVVAFGDTGLRLDRIVATVNTTIGTTIGSGSTFATRSTVLWYFLEILCKGTNIKARLQRFTDNKWLDHTGTWVTDLGSVTFGDGTGNTWAFDVTDLASSGGFSGTAGYAGIRAAGDIIADDFLFQTAPVTFPNIVQSKVVGFPVVDTTATGSITGATNPTAPAPIVITSTAHGQVSGTVVTITGVGGNTAANGTWTITKVDADHFSLNGSTGNATYTTGGTWTVDGVSVTFDSAVSSGHTLLGIVATYNYPVTGDVSDATNASPIEITTGTNHGLTTGNTVQIAGVKGNTAANGNWTITTTALNKFTLDTSTGNGSYTSNSGSYSAGYVSDQVNGSWSVLVQSSVNGNNVLSAFWVYSSGAGTPKVTIRPFAGSNGFVTVFLAELSGILQNTVDGSVQANGNAQSTNSPGTIPVSTSNELVVAAFCQGNDNIDNATVNASFTMLGLESGGVAVESLGVAAKISGTNQTPTFSTFYQGSAQTINWSGLGFSLEASSGGLFLHPLLDGITTGGPFYRNPIG